MIFRAFRFNFPYDAAIYYVLTLLSVVRSTCSKKLYTQKLARFSAPVRYLYLYLAIIKHYYTTEIVKFLSTYILHISSRWYAHGCSEIARYIIYIIGHKFQIIYISLYFVAQRTDSCNCQITVSILSISNYHLSIHRI